MKIPRLNHPDLYCGLFVFDFGDHVAVGYTAEEIDMLQSAPQYAAGRAYRIHATTPDGMLMLQGWSAMSRAVEEALLFVRRSQEQAAVDFAALRHAAIDRPPPTVVHWHRACDPDLDLPDFTILLYPAAYSQLVGRWLQEIGFGGGDQVRGGAGVAAAYRASPAQRLEVLSIAPHPRYHSRPRSEVMGSVDRRVQRELDPSMWAPAGPGAGS